MVWPRETAVETHKFEVFFMFKHPKDPGSGLHSSIEKSKGHRRKIFRMKPQSWKTTWPHRFGHEVTIACCMIKKVDFGHLFMGLKVCNIPWRLIQHICYEKTIHDGNCWIVSSKKVNCAICSSLDDKHALMPVRKPKDTWHTSITHYTFYLEGISILWRSHRFVTNPSITASRSTWTTHFARWVSVAVAVNTAQRQQWFGHHQPRPCQGVLTKDFHNDCAILGEYYVPKSLCA